MVALYGMLSFGTNRLVRSYEKKAMEQQTSYVEKQPASSGSVGSPSPSS